DLADVSGMAFQGTLDYVYDSGERKFSGQETLDGDLVRGVEHGRHRAAGADRGIGKCDGGKAARVDVEKFEGAHFREVESRERRGDALRIEQRVLDRELHVRRRELRDDRAVDVFDHRVHDRLRMNEDVDALGRHVEEV